MLLQGLTVLFTAFITCYGADIQWRAVVVTSTVGAAGTDAKVHFQILGKQGKTVEIPIDSSGKKLEAGDTSMFTFNATDVGTPENLRVWHDSTGPGPGWHLDRIELEAISGEYQGVFYFACGCWLASDQVEHGVERTIPLTKMDWTVRVTTSNIAGADSNAHVYITIYGDKGTSRQMEIDSRKDDFERGATDAYTLKTIDIGRPTKIRIHTDHNDNWNLEKIVLVNMDGAETYTFNCYCWLGMPGKTIVHLQTD